MRHAGERGFRRVGWDAALDLIADRIRRVWRIVEDIAQEPGKGRKQLADKFALSERQVQADLNLIRAELRLRGLRKHERRRTEQPCCYGDSTKCEFH